MKTKNIIIIAVIAAALIYLFRDKIFSPKAIAKLKGAGPEDESGTQEAGSAGGEAPARPLTEAEKAQFRSLKKPTPKPAVIAQPAKQPTTRRRVVVK